MSVTRVLLVDDHPLVRDGMKARLASVPGLEVVGEAGDSDQALAQLDLARPDLVLMDVGMRQVNGIELTERLLERSPALKVLMLSMYDSPEVVARALSAGAKGYVLKSAPAEEIVQAIAAIAGGGSFLGTGLAPHGAREGASRARLSQRECQILACLAEGLSCRQVAERLDMSVRTVETHRHNIRRKLNLEGQAELIKYAVERFGDPR